MDAPTLPESHFDIAYRKAAGWDALSLSSLNPKPNIEVRTVWVAVHGVEYSRQPFLCTVEIRLTNDDGRVTIDKRVLPNAVINLHGSFSPISVVGPTLKKHRHTHAAGNVVVKINLNAAEIFPSQPRGSMWKSTIA